MVTTDSSEQPLALQSDLDAARADAEYYRKEYSALSTKLYEAEAALRALARLIK